MIFHLYSWALLLMVVSAHQKARLFQLLDLLTGQCSPFYIPPINPLDPVDYYGVPCIPKGKSGIAVAAKEYAFDYIVVGAGSAGSVVASRLSEDGRNTVLLLEPGGPERLSTDPPAIAATLSDSSYDWKYRNEPVEGKFSAFKNGITLCPRGLGIGGSSIINYMMYTRGHRHDWDKICAKGNPGWDWNHILPYFKKSEKADIGPIGENSDVHNKNGMLSIQYSRYRTRLAGIFMEAVDELGERVDDYNDGNAQGFSYLQSHTKDGHRHSVARAYLYPFVNRKNLDIFYNCTVTKINIVNTIAKSVNYIYGGKTFRAHAKKEVILSAGAIASPQILMLSGVGPANHLIELGIPLIKDLKVGETLYDHPMYISLVSTFNVTGLNLKETDFSQFQLPWLLFGNGPVTMPASIEVIGYVQTNASSEPKGYPDMELVLASTSIGDVYKKVLNIDEDFYRRVYGEILDKPNFAMYPMLLHPKSKGKVTLRNKNYLSHPKIYYDYLSEEHDIETMIEGIMHAIEILKTNAFQKIGAKLHDKPFPMCLDKVFGSRAYWRCAVLAATIPNRHSMGTCKMGPSSDPYAVVDAQLRVHGIKNLRVCDASIFPIPLTAHLHAPTVVVGEKCADLIKST